MAEEHAGFANTVNAKGKAVDAREVDPFNDESEAGKIRAASQTTPSSITQFKTDDTSTNGAPAAVVPAPSEPEAETVEVEGEDKTPDAVPAEGEGANG